MVNLHNKKIYLEKIQESDYQITDAIQLQNTLQEQCSGTSPGSKICKNEANKEE